MSKTRTALATLLMGLAMASPAMAAKPHAGEFCSPHKHYSGLTCVKHHSHGRTYYQLAKD